MSDTRSYYKELLTSFINDKLDAKGIRELYAFIESDPRGYEEIMNDPDIIALAEARSAGYQSSLTEETNQRLRRRILSYANKQTPASQTDLYPSPRRQRLVGTWYWVAASLLLLIGLGIYFNFAGQKDNDGLLVSTPEEILAPTSSLAVITLSDGSRVLLDSLQNGQQTRQGNMKIMKDSAGQITYEVIGGEGAGELTYNTLTNPRGSQVIDILLSDGTQVWLNAGSSLKYPVAFTGHQRTVELKGEGYFEVAKDPAKKFVVKSDKVLTEVLGTHFNVNGFEDETAKVTLLEGAVKVTAENIRQTRILKPGEQAEVGNSLRLNEVDINKVMAWRAGFFSLDGLPFPEFMKQVSRWYDIDVIYLHGDPDIQLFGKLGRDLNLQEIVSSLKDMGVDCRIEERKLYIE